MSFANPSLAPRPLFRRSGARLLALQALALVAAFFLVGLLARVSIQAFEHQSYRADVRGELASLDDEWRHKGVDHLPHTVSKRARLWHGFEYGLAGPGGGYLAGDRRLAALQRPGWTEATSEKGGALAYTEALPGGGRLTVGRDLSTERREMAALTWILAAGGAAGVAICFAAAYLTTAWTWRRIDQLAATAAQVAGGQLDVRAPVRRGRTPDEIDELATGFNTMLDRIGRLIEQLRRVTTDVAHDMRTPMSRLRQKLERLGRAASATPEIRAAVRRLDGDFIEILRTFDALLQLAEIEGGPRADEVVDLTEVAGRVAEAYRPDIEDSGRSLTACIEPAAVLGDADLVAQAISNLLENALRHTPQGSRIELSVTGAAGAAPRLVVRDDGPGIPSELREAALAPFGRLEASRSTPGSGLGLAIASSVAQRHDARLELSDAAPGLQVAISFPAARVPGSLRSQTRLDGQIGNVGKRAICD